MVHSRQEFAEYCLRNLGAPVLEINVADDQLEDRIDEALEFWRQYHNEGVEKIYLKHRIRASALTLTTSVAADFPLMSIVTGQTSGARARCVVQTNEESAGTKLLINMIDGDFVVGETITDGITSAVIATGGIFLGEIDTKYIELPDLVYGVSRMLPFSGTSMSKSMFDIQYQLRLNDLYDLTSTSIIYYKQVMGHLALLDLELNGKPQFRFNRLSNKLYPDINWEADIALGDYVVLECYRAMDPTTVPRVWNESWLKHYATALIKRQWGTNLKKFGGLQLPGGVILDGQSMYAEAQQEIKDLEDELQTKSAPLEFFMG